MAYDEGKDKLIQDFEHEDGLHVGVYSYDEGDPRVQIGPRTYRTQSGELRYAKVGRLSQAELAWLCELGKVILTMPRPSGEERACTLTPADRSRPVSGAAPLR